MTEPTDTEPRDAMESDAERGAATEIDAEREGMAAVDERADARPEWLSSGGGREPSPATAATDGGAPSADADERALGADSNAVSAEQLARARRLLTWGALGLCSLFAVVAVIQFYVSVGAAIGSWISPGYQSIVRALFNLVVLFVSLAAISWLVRELQ